MTLPQPDQRSAQRQSLDEQIAAEPKLAPPDLPLGSTALPVETLLRPKQKPLAVAGIVENELVRPLDPDVHLPEHARVIIVAPG